MRFKLEADLVGCKAWIRSMEETERKYRDLLGELARAQEDKTCLADRTRELSDKVGSKHAWGGCFRVGA